MKLTLIKPKIGHSQNNSYHEKTVMEPLALGIIAALTPPDVEVVMYDDRIESIPHDESTDLVAITVQTFTAKRAYEISLEYKRRGVPVILGGYHPSLMPHEAKSHADSVYIGDAEGLWPKVISDAKRGKLNPFYQASYSVPQPKLLPRRDLFERKSYLPITLIQFSRGCLFECDFCAVSSFYKKSYFHRPVNEVINEIEAQKRKFILFTDDNIVMNRKVAKELFSALAPLKIRWISEGNITMAHDLELMRLMAKSGCMGHLIGIESINEDSLKSMKKVSNLSKFSQYRKELQVLRDFGIQIWAAFTLGHEYDTVETIERTLDFSLEHRFGIADFNVLLPYPNTPLYHKLAKDGRLLFDGKWWIHPDFRLGHAAFRPYRMSPEDLEKGCIGARKKFYSFGSIIHRAFDFKTNMKSASRFKIFLLSNYLHHYDTIKKQDILLGDASDAA